MEPALIANLHLKLEELCTSQEVLVSLILGLRLLSLEVKDVKEAHEVCWLFYYDIKGGFIRPEYRNTLPVVEH